MRRRRGPMLGAARCGGLWVLCAAASAQWSRWDSYDCVGDNVVYDEHPNRYIGCYADDNDAVGDLAAQEELCRSLDDGCVGVTCAAPQSECTVRHHKQCDGEFLAASDVSEVSYVKNCSNCRWERIDGRYIACYAQDDADVGTLLERQVRCHELGEDCLGVTCSDPSALPEPAGCTVRHHSACGDASDGWLLPNAGEASWVKFCDLPGRPAPPPIPKGGEGSATLPPAPPASAARPACEWKTAANKYITCFAKGDDSTGALMDMKKKCVQMGADCIGVTCRSDGTCTVRHHSNCNDNGGDNTDSTYLHDSSEGEVSYEKKCHGAAECATACYAFDEASTKHLCATDCDCAGERTCSFHGYCAGEVGQCLNGTADECSFIRHPNMYISCAASGDMSVAGLADRQARCVELRDRCAGVTCGDGTAQCSVRHHAQCPDGKYLETSTRGETSYVKTCGATRLAAEPPLGAGGGAPMALVLILLLLLAAAGGLLWKNRSAARRHIGGTGYETAHAGGEPQDDDWIDDPDADDAPRAAAGRGDAAGVGDDP